VIFETFEANSAELDKGELPRTPSARSSQNFIKANFEELPFHALGWIDPRRMHEGSYRLTMFVTCMGGKVRRLYFEERSIEG
jgi:hypothetical protein